MLAAHFSCCPQVGVLHFREFVGVSGKSNIMSVSSKVRGTYSPLGGVRGKGECPRNSLYGYRGMGLQPSQRAPPQQPRVMEGGGEATSKARAAHLWALRGRVGAPAPALASHLQACLDLRT